MVRRPEELPNSQSQAELPLETKQRLAEIEREKAILRSHIAIARASLTRERAAFTLSTSQRDIRHRRDELETQISKNQKAINVLDQAAQALRTGKPEKQGFFRQRAERPSGNGDILAEPDLKIPDENNETFANKIRDTAEFGKMWDTIIRHQDIISIPRLKLEGFTERQAELILARLIGDFDVLDKISPTDTSSTDDPRWKGANEYRLKSNFREKSWADIYGPPAATAKPDPIAAEKKEVVAEKPEKSSRLVSFFRSLRGTFARKKTEQTQAELKRAEPITAKSAESLPQPPQIDKRAFFREEGTAYQQGRLKALVAEQKIVRETASELAQFMSDAIFRHSQRRIPPEQLLSKTKLYIHDLVRKNPQGHRALAALLTDAKKGVLLSQRKLEQVNPFVTQLLTEYAGETRSATSAELADFANEKIRKREQDALDALMSRKNVGALLEARKQIEQMKKISEKENFDCFKGFTFLQTYRKNPSNRATISGINQVSEIEKEINFLLAAQLNTQLRNDFVTLARDNPRASGAEVKAIIATHLGPEFIAASGDPAGVREFRRRILERTLYELREDGTAPAIENALEKILSGRSAANTEAERGSYTNN